MSIKQYKAVVALQASIYEEDENDLLTNPQNTIRKTYAVIGDTLETCQERLTEFLERLNNDNKKDSSTET